MTKKEEAKTVRLTHANGATVVVAADRAESLITTGVFAAEKSASSKK